MARTYKYQKIKNGVKSLSTEALVEQFNALVGKRCWASARAAHNAALIDKSDEAAVKLERLTQIISREIAERAAIHFADVTQIAGVRNMGRVLSLMEELRTDLDELERLTASEFWPLPTYGELLFSVND